MARSRVIRTNKGVRERHYTWSGGAFPKPNTASIDVRHGVTTEYTGDTLIVRVDDVTKWPLVHEEAATAVARAAGGSGVQKIDKKKDR